MDPAHVTRRVLERAMPMSLEVLTKVWKCSKAYGGDLLILLAIADFADEYGKAYPSVYTLAERGRMGLRNVQYCLRHLEANGELIVHKGAGPHGTHVYEIIIGGAKFAPMQSLRPPRKHRRNKDLTSETPENIAPLQNLQGAMGFAEGVQPIAPEPSLDPLVKETTTPPIIPPKAAASKISRTKVITAVPEEFQPRPEDIATIEAEVPTVDWLRETKKFIDHDRTYGPGWKDHPAAWRNWMRKADKRFDCCRKPVTRQRRFVE